MFVYNKTDQAQTNKKIDCASACRKEGTDRKKDRKKKPDKQAIIDSSKPLSYFRYNLDKHKEALRMPYIDTIYGNGMYDDPNGRGKMENKQGDKFTVNQDRFCGTKTLAGWWFGDECFS